MYTSTSSAYDEFKLPAYIYSTTTEFGPLDNPTVGLVKLFDAGLANGEFIPIPSSVTELAGRALKVMIPAVHSEMSLLNSIVELKDFKTLPKTLYRLTTLDFLKPLLAKRLRARHRLATLRRVFKTGADGYLQAEFNILPLLSDITSIRRALESTRKQVEKLLEREQMRNRRHFNAVLGSPYTYNTAESVYRWTPPYVVGTSTTCPYSPVHGNTISYAKTIRSVRYQASFHAELEYSYYFTSYQRENARLLGLLDVLGVNCNPSILWNAIPWTFVVDWVVGVSQWLDQFKSSNMDPVTVIHNYLYSFNIQRDISMVANYGHDGVGGSSNVELSTVVENAYRRVPNLSGITEAITASGLSLKEVLLSSALATSRLRR